MGGGRGARRPRRRWLRRAVSAGAGILAVVVAGIAVLWPLTPGVGDAEARVRAQLRDVHATDPRALPIPDRVGVAVVATEDSRFYSHHGIDLLGVARALVGMARSGVDTGGATLDQQLAKRLYTPGWPGPWAKVEQAELALKLDAQYSKAQILEMYLSDVYFGHGFYGLPAAARGYFGVAPADLTWAQASLLAGLVQAPSAYDPYAHLRLAKERQAEVLGRLVATHDLTTAQAARVARQPLHLR